MGDLSRFCCQSPDCPLAGRRGHGNLTVCARCGTGQRRRLLCCRSCRRRFSERHSTPLFDCRLPHDKPLAVLRHLADGCGARQTARLTGVGKNAIGRPAKAAGERAQRLHDESLALSPRHPHGAAG
jgi:LacI family transcriptional regulator